MSSNTEAEYFSNGITEEIIIALAKIQELRMHDLIQVRDMLASNKLITIIDRIYPLDQIQEAHKYVDTGRKRGNVIVTM